MKQTRTADRTEAPPLELAGAARELKSGERPVRVPKISGAAFPAAIGAMAETDDERLPANHEANRAAGAAAMTDAMLIQVRRRHACRWIFAHLHLRCVLA